MVIVLNPFCSYGRGLARWNRIEEELSSRVGPFALDILQSPDCLPSQISRWLRAGETTFIAAGGDGTVNLLLNALLTANSQRNDVVLGAIGLGSSNDYHKQFETRTQIGGKGIPLRIDVRRATACDVIRVRYIDEDDRRQTRFCLNNASIGVTAEANDSFNNRPGFTQLLRKISINAAITATAADTIFHYRNIPGRMAIDGGEPEEIQVTNLGIVKNPHFAGSLHYEPVVQPDDGRFGVHLCEGMSRWAALGVLSRLSRGRFQGSPKTRTWRAQHLRIESLQRFAVELDGEIVRTRAAEFSVECKAVRCCP